MKKSILLSAFLATNLFAPTITTLANEEMTEVRTEASSFLTTPEDFYKLNESFTIHVAKDPALNTWEDIKVPINSDVKLSISNTSLIPGADHVLGSAYIENIQDFLPSGYVQYSDEERSSINSIHIERDYSMFPEIWAVPALNFKDIQAAKIQFIRFNLQSGQMDGTYELPIQEDTYIPTYLSELGEGVYFYTINVKFSDYEKDLEKLVGGPVTLSVPTGYDSSVPEGYYRIPIYIENNGNAFHDTMQDAGIPFVMAQGTTSNDPTSAQPEEKKSLYRLYNTVSGEHFFTMKLEERDQFLTNPDWKEEGIGWTVPEVSDSPIYCVANPNTNDHHYTMDKNEYEALKSLGWIDGGISFYSATGEHQDQGLVPLYRLYNPNHKGTGSHHYTVDENERDTLVSQGWNNEGIAWHGLKSE